MNNQTKNTIKKVVLWSSLFLFLSSCDWLDLEPKICQVGDAILYENELNERIQFFYPDENYEEAKEKAIEDWVMMQQISLEIQEKSPQKAKENQFKIQDDLLKYNLFDLENAYILEKMDSIVEESEIEEYYELHRQDYKTNSFIVKALYIKIPDSLVEQANLEKYYLLKNDKDLEKIEKYANLYASSFYFEKKRWIYYDDLMREVPLSSEQKEEIVKARGKEIVHENGETHYINILDYQTKSISSPMEVERERIKNHILKQRANKLRRTVKERTISNVKEKYTVTYF